MKEYRIIIAGSRDFNNQTTLNNIVTDYILKKYLDDDMSIENSLIKFEIISGHANGADTLGEKFAIEMGYKLTLFQANWNKYGKSAGPIRNRQMAEYANENGNGVLFAFWDGHSKGTKNMIDMAKRYGLEMYVHRYSYLD